MARQLFGTDGIRGVAGEFPLDARTAWAFGAALGEWARRQQPDAGGHSPEIVIGMDTRESGPWLAECVAGGLARQGVRARFAGLITTPGVAWLTKNEEFVAGVMISASHNQYRDNGLKAFAHTGYKLPDADEHSIEDRIFALLDSGENHERMPLSVDEGLDLDYSGYLASTMSGSLGGLKLVVDCANGAAAHLAPDLFRRLGAAVTLIHAAPNGRNINLDCGALYLDSLRSEVLARGAQAGAAFDGDADRAMFISHSGKLIDGDHVLLVAARALQAAGRLAKQLVVATVMSNLGFERALRSSGIGLTRTSVGDRYVLEEMLRSGAVLGGEQSGHVIFLEQATTGDGMLTAIRVLEIMAASGKSLDELTAGFEVYPQRLVNIRVRERRPLEELAAVRERITDAERDFGEAGRVLVRFSGTEPLARVMVEGPDLTRVERQAARIADAIRAELG